MINITAIRCGFCLQLDKYLLFNLIILKMITVNKEKFNFFKDLKSIDMQDLDMNKTINIFEYKCKKGEENNTFGCMETFFFA